MLDFALYKPTDLEKSITELYNHFCISSPSDIVEAKIALLLNIKLLYSDVPSQSFEKGIFRCIVIDQTLSEVKQREDFFHELGHLFRGHAGDQNTMPSLFRELQEGQADHFLMYAAMPFFMIEKMEMPMYERDVPHTLSREFKVSIELASNRWAQIKRRISQGRWDKALIEYENSRYRKADPVNWCDDAKKIFRLAIDRKMQQGQGVIIR